MSTTEASLNAVYSDEQMNTTIYRLHSVLVHQGQASGGHYWCYVRRPPSLHVTTTPHMQATPSSSVEVCNPPKLSQSVSNSETVMNSPATSTESGGVEGEEARLGSREEEEGKKLGVKQDNARLNVRKKENETGGTWLKFNDVSVHEVTWAEVMKESYGGYHNTSAYCLIYLSPQLHEAWASSGEHFTCTRAATY